jgi:sugar phosphate isomerase/epimerase
MEIRILSPTWGLEHLGYEKMLRKIFAAGYDGLDTWIPQDPDDKRTLFDFLSSGNITLVTHQYRAAGSTFKDFRKSFLEELKSCAGPKPLLINSHTGKDHFTKEQLLDLIDIAAEFSDKTGITVAHETHRGRLGYSPQSYHELATLHSRFPITADFSHWVCVTESMLENFGPALKLAIQNTVHIHARVGYEEGPQVTDPRATQWQYAVEVFSGWWDEIVAVNKQQHRPILTITTEFGPAPYLVHHPATGAPLVDQFEINCYMKDYLKRRYKSGGPG